MNNKIIIRLTVLLLLTSLLVACNSGSAPEAEGEADAPPTPTPVIGVPVEVGEVGTGNLSLIYTYNGNMKAKDDVSVFPSASGKIIELLVDVGDVVEAGQPIAVIETDVYEIQLAQAMAGLKSAELNLAKMKLGSRPEEISTAQAAVQLARAVLNDVVSIDDNERTSSATALAQAETALRQAQTEYDKIAWAGNVGQTQQAAQLEQATVGYESALAAYNLQTNPNDSQVAPLMLQVAQAELQLALSLNPFRQVDFDLAEASVDQAQASVDLAQKQLDDTVVVAPFDGVVADLFIAKGSQVGPQSPLVRFVTQEVEVEIKVEESRIADIEPGQFAALRVSAYPGQDFAAQVTTVSPVANADTRTFAVTVQPDDAEMLLRSGMYANVSILVEEKSDVTLTPFTAVTIQGEEQVVYIVGEDNTVTERVIETGDVDGDRIEVLSGLEDGDTVVIVGQGNLIDGTLVEVVQ